LAVLGGLAFSLKKIFLENKISSKGEPTKVLRDKRRLNFGKFELKGIM